MRFVFLIHDFDHRKTHDWITYAVRRSRMQVVQDWWRKQMRVNQVYGGILNIMRHCAVARSCGADAVLATMSGRDTYSDQNLYQDLPFIRWADRQPDDICIVPDCVTELIDQVEGRAIAYLQSPIFVFNNFDYQDNRVALWTDSLHMQSICQATFLEKEVQIVPNIVDNQLFPFIPQSERQQGLVFAFPRKGPEFIAKTQEIYNLKGGKHWQFELIDGLSIHELAKQFRRPQVFLASAEIEGCALPPQESMAAGIVVVGKTASGANFCMEHYETAMTAENPEEAAQCLLALENAELRDKLSRNAHEYISHYFPENQPSKFWHQVIDQYATTAPEKRMH
jgi:hypothetical protein